MPQVTISTFSTITKGIKVERVFCEDSNVRNVTREVNLPDKYSSKKHISGTTKVQEDLCR